MINKVKLIVGKISDLLNSQFSLISKCFLGLILVQTLFLFVTFFKWGPALSGDTLSYLNSANAVMQGSFPYSHAYSPGYPFLIAVLSQVLLISLEQAALLACVFFYAAGLFLFYKIVITLTGFGNRILVLGISLLLINYWWSIGFIFKAHADGLLFVFHLFLFFSLLQFLQTQKPKWYIIAALVAATAVWVKYNSLIYLPYLAIVPFIYYGWKKKSFLGLLPVVLSSASFLLFKFINGTVIHHLETSEKSFRLWQGEASKETLLTNLSDTGRVLAGSVFSDIIADRLPGSVSILITGMLFAAIIFYAIKMFGRSDINLVLVIFPVGYIAALGLLFQFSNHTEMTYRTLFPAVIILLLAMLHVTVRHRIKTGIFVITFFVFLQPLRTMAGLIDWYRTAPMDSFVLARKFSDRPSVKRLNELMKEKKLKAENVYTNNHRYMVIHFNYQWVKKMYEETVFRKGKPRPVDQMEIDMQCNMIYREILSGNSIVILFNVDRTRQTCLIDAANLQQEKIDNDLIIYK
jgi:hypothetical protein